MRHLLITLLACWTASGATYYVDYSTGSDANNGTAKATPWKRAPGMRAGPA